jgi:transposase
VQGRHPRQTSDALGSAASQLGPRALALATQLNKGLGLPYGKTATVLEQAFGLQVSRGGLCQALGRVASKAEPTYNALVEEVRRSASVTPDETGWRVGGKLWWMWAFSTPQVTVYNIQPGRGFEQAALVLGADFAGFLVRDGWSIYRQFYPRSAPNLLSAPAAALPGDDSGGGKRGGGIPAHHRNHLAAIFAAA